MISIKRIAFVSVVFYFFTVQAVSIFSYPNLIFTVARRALFGQRKEIEHNKDPLPSYLLLPSSYYQFLNINIRHIESVRQFNNACAWYSVCNAVAIDLLGLRAQPLTSCAIKQVVEKELLPLLEDKKDQIVKTLDVKKWFHGLNILQKEQLARCYHLSNYYCIRFEPQERWMRLYMPKVPNALYPYFDKGEGGLYIVKSPRLFLKKICADLNNQVIHFLISAPSRFDCAVWHAVLVTVITYGENEKPTVLYMDSNNNCLSSLDDWIMPAGMHLFFKTLHEAFGAD